MTANDYFGLSDFLCIMEGENVSAVDFQHRRMDLVVVVHEVKVMVVLERRAKRHGCLGYLFGSMVMSYNETYMYEMNSDEPKVPDLRRKYANDTPLP